MLQTRTVVVVQNGVSKHDWDVLPVQGLLNELSGHGSIGVCEVTHSTTRFTLFSWAFLNSCVTTPVVSSTIKIIHFWTKLSMYMIPVREVQTDPDTPYDLQDLQKSVE